MKTDSMNAEIIDDSDEDKYKANAEDDDDEEYIIIPKIKEKKGSENDKDTSTRVKRSIVPQHVLKKCHNENDDVFEIGVDEAGRGPLFGRVYTAAVILPKDDTFDHSKMKDSKKFHSKKKIEEVAEYIKENAISWYVSFEDEKKIDEINILQATQLSMRNSIIEVRKQLNKKQKGLGKEENKDYSYNLLIDGNYFNPIMYLDKKTNKMETLPFITVEGGDNTYSSIAAASILAKVERDKYIEQMCADHPELSEHYGIDSNKGYGAKRHLDGIKEHGITIWHRRSFGICKNYM
jgi:ribonuclease HII